MNDRVSQNQCLLEIRTHQATREGLDFVAELFDKVSKESGITRTEFADEIQRDPSYLSRVLNGRVSNVNYQTIARMIIALGYWPTIHAEPIKGAEHRSNYCAGNIEFPIFGTTAAPQQTMDAKLPTKDVASTHRQSDWKIDANV